MRYQVPCIIAVHHTLADEQGTISCCEGYQRAITVKNRQGN